MRFFTPHTPGPSDEDAKKGFYRPKTIVRLLAATTIVVAIALLTAPRFHVARIDVQPGERVSETIRAEFPFEVQDKAARLARLEQEVAKAGTVYDYDPDAFARVKRDIEALVDEVGKFEDANDALPPEKRKDYGRLANNIRKRIQVNLSSSSLQLLSSEIRSKRVVQALEAMYRQLYTDRVIVEPWYPLDWKMGAVRVESPAGDAPKPAKLDSSNVLVHPSRTRKVLDADYLPRFVYPLIEPSSECRQAILQLAVGLTEYSLRRDEKETARRREYARASVKPVYHPFVRHDVIVAEGEIPSNFQLEALREYRSQIRKHEILRIAAYLSVIVTMLFFLVIYARRFRPQLRFRTSTIVIIGIPLLVVLVVGRMAIFLLSDRFAPDFAGYLFPAALVGMLGVILLDTELAIVLVLISSVLIGLATNMSLQHTLPALFGGLTAVVALYRLHQRGQLFIAAIYVSVVQVITIGIVQFIHDPSRIYYGAALLGTVNGALSYLLAIGMFPLFESLFGITTDLKLLELTGINHPLLRELEEQAPGTYQHSLNVAKLAEAAAEEIGANYLLVRAGAYFHDVGKSLKPRYFSENQISPDERRTHEKLTPFMSCLIIRNHVKEGIELARRYGIPERVIDFIPQHHGTCLIKYFYHEAIRQYEESESAEPVREADFRYPGPKPQSIEAAIVMVADSVEATATSRLNRPRIDEDDIRHLVKDATQEKFNDGQFDDSHLTMRQLHEIRESMVRTLVGRFHHRIEYPSPSPAPSKKAPKEPAVA